MRFRVGREALGEAVAWVARALPSRPVVPVLSGLMLDAKAGGLTLSCFDYEIAARVQIEAEVEEPGSALVPGRLLAEITRSLPGRPAEFADDGDAVSLRCGSAEFTLVALPLEDYPALPEPPPVVGTVDGSVFAIAASQVGPAASRDDTLPILTAVCLEVNGQALTLAATDRYRLAVRELPWQPAAPQVRAVAMVPARTMADVARTMAPGVPVRIAFTVEAGSAGSQAAREPKPSDGMISFDAGGRRLIVRLISGEFIKYQSRFPTEFGCRADLPAVAFTEAVRRVSLVAERASPVRLAFGSGQVVIEARTEGRARAVETVPAAFTGDEPQISFNPHYLLDGLAAATAEGGSGTATSGARGAGTGTSGTGASGTGASGSGASGAATSGSGTSGASATAASGSGGSGTGTSGTGTSDGGVDVSPAGSAEPPAGPPPGRIRLEFTSPAKPALITWASAGTSDSDEDHDAAADGDQEELPGLPAAPAEFRYLLVPQRVPVRT